MRNYVDPMFDDGQPFGDRRLPVNGWVQWVGAAATGLNALANWRNSRNSGGGQSAVPVTNRQLPTVTDSQRGAYDRLLPGFEAALGSVFGGPQSLASMEEDALKYNERMGAAQQFEQDRRAAYEDRLTKVIQDTLKAPTANRQGNSLFGSDFQRQAADAAATVTAQSDLQFQQLEQQRAGLAFQALLAPLFENVVANWKNQGSGGSGGSGVGGAGRGISRVLGQDGHTGDPSLTASPSYRYTGFRNMIDDIARDYADAFGDGADSGPDFGGGEAGMGDADPDADGGYGGG